MDVVVDLTVLLIDVFDDSFEACVFVFGHEVEEVFCYFCYLMTGDVLKLFVIEGQNRVCFIVVFGNTQNDYLLQQSVYSIFLFVELFLQ